MMLCSFGAVITLCKCQVIKKSIWRCLATLCSGIDPPVYCPRRQSLTVLCLLLAFSSCRQLMAGDVLTHFNGVVIADDGTFLFREAVRINFGHLVSQAFNGDVAMVSTAALRITLGDSALQDSAAVFMLALA
jgi:hypothetical protein